jgi:hypothetical protein
MERLVLGTIRRYSGRAGRGYDFCGFVERDAGIDELDAEKDAHVGIVSDDCFDNDRNPEHNRHGP